MLEIEVLASPLLLFSFGNVGTFSKTFFRWSANSLNQEPSAEPFICHLLSLYRTRVISPIKFLSSLGFFEDSVSFYVGSPCKYIFHINCFLKPSSGQENDYVVIPFLDLVLHVYNQLKTFLIVHHIIWQHQSTSRCPRITGQAFHNYWRAMCSKNCICKEWEDDQENALKEQLWRSWIEW